MGKIEKFGKLIEKLKKRIVKLEAKAEGIEKKYKGKLIKAELERRKRALADKATILRSKIKRLERIRFHYEKKLREKKAKEKERKKK